MKATVTTLIVSVLAVLLACTTAPVDPEKERERSIEKTKAEVARAREAEEIRRRAEEMRSRSR